MRRLFPILLTGAVLMAAAAAEGADRPPVKATGPGLPPVSGYISLYAGASAASWKLLLWEFSDTLFVAGGDGRVNVWTGPNTAIQLDAEAEGTSRFDLPQLNLDLGGRRSGILGGHLAYRNPTSHALGVFGGVAAANNVRVLEEDNSATTYGLLGVEGQGYFGNTTLYPQAGYLFRVNGPDGIGVEYTPDHAWFARLAGRYFVTPDDKVAAEIGYAKVSHEFNDSSFDSAILNWGVSYEHRFGPGPWGLFVEYSGFQNRLTSDLIQFKNGVAEHVFLAGVRVHFGQGSLLSQDRTGATFDMPKFIRALPWHTGLMIQN